MRLERLEPERDIPVATLVTSGPGVVRLITREPADAGPATDGSGPDCANDTSPDMLASMTEFNWDEVNGHAVERLSKPKIRPVPAPIVRQAQRSVDADPVNLKDTLILEHEFPTEEQAVAFAAHMRAAGHHTKPAASIHVKPDPDKEGNPRLVRWQAKRRPGRVPQPVAAPEPEQPPVMVDA